MNTVHRLCRLALALGFLIAGGTAAHAEWRRAESPHFVVYSEGSESKLRERVLLLEDFDRLLRTITTIEAPPGANKLHVFIVSGGSELRQIRDVPSSTAGFYSASPEGIAAFVDSRAEYGGNEVLFHEYAHHFMMQYNENTYPAWYVEGFAEYVMTADFSRRHIDIGKFSEGRIARLVDGGWLPLEHVLWGTLDGLNEDARFAFYAQSWLLTHWFYSTSERQQALLRYLALARRGDPREALEAATGMDADALQAELRRYISGRSVRYRRMPRPDWETAQVAIAELPRAAGGLMLHEAALRVGISDERAAEALERVRREAARHPDDPYAMRILAWAELLHGDAAAADRLLTALAASAPEDPELLYLRGRYHLALAEQSGDPADTAAAKEWFGRAYALDPNHWQTLYRYAQTLRGERTYLSENTSNILLLATQLAPQVAEIRLNAAAQLVSRRETDQAAALLRPLLTNPHDPGLAEAAQRMLAQANRKGAEGEEEPADE